MQVSSTSNNPWLQYAQQSLSQAAQTTQENSAGGQSSTGGAASGSQGGGLAALLSSGLQSPATMFSSSSLNALISAQADGQSGDPTDPTSTDPTQTGSGSGAVHHHHHGGGGGESVQAQAQAEAEASGQTDLTGASTTAASSAVSGAANSTLELIMSQLIGAA